MKSRIIISCIIAMFGLVQLGGAADEKRAADHEALRALREKAAKAINVGDMKELRACLAKDFTFIASDQSVLTSGAELVTYWDGMFKNEKSPVVSVATKITAEILTKFTGPDTGYCRGTSRDVYTLRNKRKIALRNTWSTLLVKEEGAWKIGAAHVGINFLDNPVLAAKKMSWFGRLLVGVNLRKLPGEVKE